MTKLEEVAAAIAAVEPLGIRVNGRVSEVFYHSEPEVVSPVVIRSFADHDEANRWAEAETNRRRARAAIEALRNPPEFVLDAMNPSGRYASTVVVEAWNDAIDAILSNTKEGG